MEYTTKSHINFPLLDAFLTNKEVPVRDFYIEQYPKTKMYILSHGGTEDCAKDIFQEAFFSCWKKLSSGKFTPAAISEIQAYLFTASKNKWIDKKRRESKNREIALDPNMAQMAEDHLVFNDEKHIEEKRLTITLSAFEQLGQACKELLTLFYFEKESLKLIAEKLNIEEASAKNKKYRCIQKLKELASDLN
ncbi:MAG: RNA polymerase sigma factor [Aquaticitalea sp.]